MPEIYDEDVNDIIRAVWSLKGKDQTTETLLDSSLADEGILYFFTMKAINDKEYKLILSPNNIQDVYDSYEICGEF